jgi:SAM-dependent MidA family methyltransferase
VSLAARLEAQIRALGPLDVAQYMTACLHDPDDGYYARRPALGEAGDFITAPLVSQMFGELIGLWALALWRGLGRPARLILAEAGPGDGTLIADALRAAALDAGFIAAAELWLIETSAPLAARQAERLAGAAIALRWAASLAELPVDAPIILVANELLDCLPARQFVRTAGGWAERMVGLGETGGLAFGLRPCAPPACAPPADIAAEPGAVVEVSAAQAAFAAELAARIARQGGAGLLIDYGRDRPGFGDTLQALRGHRKESPLAAPGLADLTVHADFPTVLAAARTEGAAAALLTQRTFLRRLGIEARAEALSRAHPERAPTIGRQLARLIGDDEMGRLFKAACIYPPHAPPPPAFETPE